jgi:hypothetical protein
VNAAKKYISGHRVTESNRYFLRPLFDFLRLRRNHAVGNRGAGVSPEAFLPKLLYDSITSGKPTGELRPNASMENRFGRDARATVRALPQHGHG